MNVVFEAAHCDKSFTTLLSQHYFYS